MSVNGTIAVECPACGRESEVKLVQSINARTEPELEQRLIAGELNILACACGRRTQLAATLLFTDPDADFYCQVVPGGDAEMAKAADLFLAVGATGIQRLVPSPNALVEKIKLLRENLEDWAIEMAKILLLATEPEKDLDRVMLFDRADANAIHWLLYTGTAPEPAASTRASYERLASQLSSRPKRDELRIDRAWALGAVQRMIANAN